MEGKLYARDFLRSREHCPQEVFVIRPHRSFIDVRIGELVCDRGMRARRYSSTL